MSLPTANKISLYQYRCRICLEATNGEIALNKTINYTNAEISLKELLEFCVNQQVCENGKADGLCLACMKNGIVCYKFKKKYEESQSILLKEIEEDNSFSFAIKIEADLNEEDLMVVTENEVLKEEILDDDVSLVATDNVVLKKEILDDDVSVVGTDNVVIKEEILDDDVSVVATDNLVLKKEILDDDVSVVATENGVLNEEISGNEISQIAENTVSNLLPNKSRPQYEKQYGKFCEWCNDNNVTAVSENVLIAYFELQREKYKPTSLWATYSMLKSCLSIYKDVDISKYNKLQILLKRISRDYAPKRSKVLEEEDIHKFIRDADDKFYLAMKIVLIMGYNGALSRKELMDISVDDIEYRLDSIIVSVSKTKRNIPRMFTITDTHWIELIKNYAKLRPNNVKHNRFFLTYRNGHCINSPIGINFMGKISKDIATFLKLPDSDLYTGHCFRRSSATHLANHGGELVTIRKDGVNLPGCSSSAPQLQCDSNRNSSTVYNVPGVSITAEETSSVNINVFNNCTIEERNLN